MSARRPALQGATCQPAVAQRTAPGRWGLRGSIFGPARRLTVDGSLSRRPVVPAAPHAAMRRHRRTGDRIHRRNRAAVSLSSEAVFRVRPRARAPLRRPGEPSPRPPRAPRRARAAAPPTYARVCAGRWLAWHGAGRQAGVAAAAIKRARAGGDDDAPLPLRAPVEAGCRPFARATSPAASCTPAST